MLRTSVVSVLPTHPGKTEGGLSLGVLFLHMHLCVVVLLLLLLLLLYAADGLLVVHPTG
jgi:hypothetical protein